MANPATIAAALETRLNTVTGLTGIWRTPGTVNPPVALVGMPDPIEYHFAIGPMGDAAKTRWTFPVLLLVQLTDQESAQAALYAFMATTGSASVPAALESDNTLGGAASSVVVRRCENLGEYSFANVNYLGASFLVDVLA